MTAGLSLVDLHYILTTKQRSKLNNNPKSCLKMAISVKINELGSFPRHMSLVS
jgi:hypothetical protein